MDTRAQSIGIARFFLALGVGAIAYFILDHVTSPVLDRATNSTGNATANQATVWFTDIVGLVPIMILFLAFLSVIVLTVFQREVLR
jgi:hypothetical protein